VHATFGAGAEAQHQILDESTPENSHFQPPKGAVGVSLKRLRRTPPTGGEVIKVGLEKRQKGVFLIQLPQNNVPPCISISCSSPGDRS